MKAIKYVKEHRFITHYLKTGEGNCTAAVSLFLCLSEMLDEKLFEECYVGYIPPSPFTSHAMIVKKGDKGVEYIEVVSPSRDYLAHLHMPILNLLLCEKQFIIADLLVSIGAHLYDQNRDEEALECFNKAIEIDSNHYEAWFNKGFLLLQLGNYKEAAECFNKAIEIYPNELFAWYYKEAALSYLNKKEEAVECLKEARKK